VRAAQPLFLAIMILGSVILYLAVPFWMMHDEVVFCHLRVWFICIGFTLLFGTLTLKTFRIKTIFLKTLNLKKVKAYSDQQMLLPILALVILDCFLCLIWSAVTSPSVVLVVIDQYRPAINFLECVWPENFIALLTIMLVYKALMVAFGIYLSVLLWKYGFGNSMFVESRQIIFSMYNLIIFIVIGIALQASLQGADSRETLFVTRSICVFLSGVITIIAILLPRLQDPDGIEHAGKDLAGKTNSTIDSKKDSNTTGNYEALSKKYEQLKEQYKTRHPDSDVELDE